MALVLCEQVKIVNQGKCILLSMFAIILYSRFSKPHSAFHVKQPKTGCGLRKRLHVHGIKGLYPPLKGERGDSKVSNLASGKIQI